MDSDRRVELEILGPALVLLYIRGLDPVLNPPPYSPGASPPERCSSNFSVVSPFSSKVTWMTRVPYRAFSPACFTSQIRISGRNSVFSAAYSRLCHGEWLDHFVDRRLARCQPREDRPPGLVKTQRAGKPAPNLS